MGIFDRASAAARLVADQVKTTAVETAREFDAGLSDKSDYRTLRQLGQDALTSSKQYLAEGRELGVGLMREVGETEAGAATGTSVRTLGKQINALPVLSAIVDSFKARHGIEELATRLVEEPENPLKAVQLAEGMSRVTRDLTYYRRTRSIISPTYAIRRQLIVGAVGLGLEDSDATVVCLQKRAFFQAKAQIHADPTNTNALHTMARVYLNEGDRVQALVTSKLAVLSEPKAGVCWITLARCYLLEDRVEDARSAASKAVSLGQSYGNEVLAALALIDAEGGVRDTSLRFDELRASVKPQDRQEYLGAPLGAKAAWDTLLETQWTKGVDSWSKFKQWMEM